MNESNPENKLSLIAQLEALLFVAPESVSAAQLATALDIRVLDVEEALDAMEAIFAEHETERGLRLQRYHGRVQLTTAPQAARAVERFLGLDIRSRLSRASLEALAIVLYRQPVTRPQVEAIRGVNSDGVMRTLLFKGLIQEIGRAESPGRPILYSATTECIQYFGLSSLAGLPPLELDQEHDNGSADDQLKD